MGHVSESPYAQYSGALVKQILNNNDHCYTTGSWGGGDVGFGFNARNSNSIYGNSSTIQPPAISIQYLIKY